jgi:hypothetical protein
VSGIFDITLNSGDFTGSLVMTMLSPSRVQWPLAD